MNLHKYPPFMRTWLKRLKGLKIFDRTCRSVQFWNSQFHLDALFNTAWLIQIIVTSIGKQIPVEETNRNRDTLTGLNSFTQRKPLLPQDTPNLCLPVTVASCWIRLCRDHSLSSSLSSSASVIFTPNTKIRAGDKRWSDIGETRRKERGEKAGEMQPADKSTWHARATWNHIRGNENEPLVTDSFVIFSRERPPRGVLVCSLRSHQTSLFWTQPLIRRNSIWMWTLCHVHIERNYSEMIRWLFVHRL